jgi:serine/threonine-protein kinase
VQITDGLEAIHRVGVIHRDLKTANIMLEPSGTVRLMDFGIAKHVTQDAAGATATGHIVGTPSYMSPEQARAEKLDFRSDIYSLGVVLYELFTGRVPFEGDTPIAVILKHIHDPPPLAGPGTEKLPPNLVPVLARALAKSRAERFQTAAELGRALRTAAGESFALPSAVGERTPAMGGPSGPTLPAERAWRGTTQVQEPTQDSTAATIGLPPTQVAAEPTLKRTVALRDEARFPKDRTSAAVAIGIGAVLVIAILLVARPRPSAPVTVAPAVAVSLSASPVGAARSLTI